MKPYKTIALRLALCLVFLAWPLLTSAQKIGNPAPKTMENEKEENTAIKGTGENPEMSKGSVEAYKKNFKKEIRALNKKIADLDKKIRLQGSKLEGEAKEAWEDMKAKQKVLKDKLKAFSSATQKTWGKTRSEAEAAKEDLRKAFEKVEGYFK